MNTGSVDAPLKLMLISWASSYVEMNLIEWSNSSPAGAHVRDSPPEHFKFSEGKPINGM